MLNGNNKWLYSVCFSALIGISSCSGGSSNPVSPPPPPPPPPPTSGACAQINETGVSKPSGWDSGLDFTGSLIINNNVSGDINGDVKFIQSITIDPIAASGDNRPDLTMHKPALVLFRPLVDDLSAMELTVTNQGGQTHIVNMSHPYDLPSSDQDTTDGRPIVYFSKCSWSATIPATFVTPQMSLSLKASNGDVSALNAADINVSAPSETVTQNIAIGMLVHPDNNTYRHFWTYAEATSDPTYPEKLAKDFFQKLPISRFIVGEYEAAYFPKVTMPNGNVYTDKSSDTTSGFYTGDMRQNIAKEMVATGINLAGIGIPYSAGGNEQQARPYRQTTVFTSQGVYTDPDDGTAVIATHGLSGGGGQLTLLSTKGNEYTHEYGHDFGIGHYPGAIASIHSIAGGWGFNFDQGKFLGNLRWRIAARRAENPDGVGREPFQDIFTYNTDPMASGIVTGSVSEFTLFTANTSKVIQDDLIDKGGRINETNDTGYERWDSNANAMVEYDPDLPKPSHFGIPVTTLVGFYDPELTNPSQIYPALYGNYGHVFNPASMVEHDTNLTNSNCSLRVYDSNNVREDFPLFGSRVDPNLSNKFHVNLDRSKAYQYAEIYCQNLSNGQQEQLTFIDIQAPKANANPPIIIGQQ